MFLPLALLIAAFTLPLTTLPATQTVGCQARADLRRRQGCHHAQPPTVKRDASFWHAYPKRH